MDNKRLPLPGQPPFNPNPVPRDTSSSVAGLMQGSLLGMTTLPTTDSDQPRPQHHCQTSDVALTATPQPLNRLNPRCHRDALNNHHRSLTCRSPGAAIIPVSKHFCAHYSAADVRHLSTPVRSTLSLISCFCSTPCQTQLYKLLQRAKRLRQLSPSDLACSPAMMRRAPG